MGIFDIFNKRKKRDSKKEYKPQESGNPEISEAERLFYFFNKLKEYLEREGHKAELNEQYAALTLNNELEIAGAILPGNYHPNLMPLLLLTMHKDLFPNGIETSAVGLGSDLDMQCKMAIENYVQSSLPVILDSMTDTHIEELDFHAEIEGKKALWHPKVGQTGFQGNWDGVEGQRDFYQIVRNKLPEIMADQKINWLYMYCARQKNGDTSIECNFNNERWTKGEELLYEYSRTWKKQKDFLGQKQFVVIRRCDASDN